MLFYVDCTSLMLFRARVKYFKVAQNNFKYKSLPFPLVSIAHLLSVETVIFT
jgi:hypothetical protein